MTSFLYSVPASDLDKQHKVKFVQCNGIPPNIHKTWEERFNVPVFEVYGSTETGTDIAVTHDTDAKWVLHVLVARSITGKQRLLLKMMLRFSLVK